MIKTIQHRRKFVQAGIAGLFTAIFGGIPKIGSSQPAPGNKIGFIVRETEGLHILTGRRKVPMTIKISKTRHGIEHFSFCMENLGPGRKMRIHKHLYNDELIFIHKGEGSLTLDEQSLEVKTGDIAFIPRGIWHGMNNTGKENILMAFQYAPSGFEEYFIENGTLEGMPAKVRTEEEYAIAEKKYGMVYKQPFSEK